MYTCTNYCDILLQGHSYPVWLLPWSATTSQGNQGSWPWNWKQTHNSVSGITQTFTLGEALTDMRKKQFLQSLNSKYILLICTILLIFDPLDHLASVRKLPRQLKAEPSCSAHHHVPEDWDMAFTCPAALLLSQLCKGTFTSSGPGSYLQPSYSQKPFWKQRYMMMMKEGSGKELFLFNPFLCRSFWGF